MNIDEQKLLLRYARLMLEIALAQNPSAIVDITPDRVQTSGGYKELRAFYVRLSDRRKADFRRFMRTTIDGVADMMAKAKETGESFSLADIEIDVFDATTGKAVEAPDFNQAQEQDDGESTGSGSNEHGAGAQARAQGSEATDGDRGDHKDRQDPRTTVDGRS